VRALVSTRDHDEEVQRLSADVRPTGPRSLGARVTSEPEIYRRDDHQGPSWVRDMIGVGLSGDFDAAERLRRNNKAVSLQVRAQNTTGTSGGDFVPPLWLMSEMAELARAGRVAANLVRNQALPRAGPTRSTFRRSPAGPRSQSRRRRTAPSRTPTRPGRP
jgi:hypothetical protein